MNSNADRQRAFRRRMAERGLKQVTVLVPERDEQRLKQYAARLVRQLDQAATDHAKTPPEQKPTAPRSPKRFTPPSVDEVRAYCQERGNRVDSDAFVDHYTAKGWMIGKNRMKDWKAAVRTWERRDRDSAASRSEPTTAYI